MIMQLPEAALPNLTVLRLERLLELDRKARVRDWLASGVMVVGEQALKAIERLVR